MKHRLLHLRGVRAKHDTLNIWRWLVTLFWFLVIEDKADTTKYVKITDTGIIDMGTKAVTDYAVNGAYYYAKHIA